MSRCHYTFDLTRAHTHMVGVTAAFAAHGEAHLDLTLPAWLPGAYKIFDNARNLRVFEAIDASGAPLRYERLDWQTWRVFDGGEGATVRYDVFCNKPEIHQGQLDAHHAFLNPGVLALYARGHQADWPVTLDVVAPDGWQVATAMRAEGGARFSAPHYDAFIDCPLQVGHFALASFELDGITYEIVYEGATPFNPAVLVSPLQRIVAAASGFWGKPPLEPENRYVFMFLETQAGFLNGLEHRSSTIITGPVADPAQREGLLTMSCHEFFHLWNVKRLRPLGHGPFDYTREAHTTALWIVEGMTEYFADLLMLRAGLVRPEGFYAGMAGYVQQLMAMPGRFNMSVEEASWTTWHFGDDRWNGALNYYVKGYLIALALDLTLRGRSDNRVSLDDVMRAMWARYGALDTAYDPADFCRVAEEVLGESLEDFWTAYVRARGDADWNTPIAHAGLVLVRGEEQAVMELTLKDNPAAGALSLPVIENVLADGAAQRAGLMAGDMLVAIGDQRATPELLAHLGSLVDPGDQVDVAFFRRERLQVTTVTMGAHAYYHVLPTPEATAAQQALRSDWLASMSRRAASPSR